ncbi:MAG TPA: hypothetical protein VF574_12330 [Allosphingosinicella sp.]
MGNNGGGREKQPERSPQVADPSRRHAGRWGSGRTGDDADGEAEKEFYGGSGRVEAAGGGGYGEEDFLTWPPGESPDPVQKVEEGGERIRIRLEHDGLLGLGSTGWFLQEVDAVLDGLVGPGGAERAEVESIGSGSLTIIIVIGAIPAAKGAWSVFKHFQAQWHEREMRREQWAREDRLRQEERDYQDRLKREQWEREDRLLREQREHEERRAKAQIDPNVTNIIIAGGVDRYELGGGSGWRRLDPA